ncbi:site-specific integrase [Candidatus Woesearchaeota archaeon]|nr:site-specific integrase [Candidatus Woesearchaeota archaeon]
MADNDIYNSKAKYDRLAKSLDYLILPIDKRPKDVYQGKYQIKNPGNLQYFKRLISKFEAQDLSYIRRKRFIEVLLTISHITNKDFAELQMNEEESDKVASQINKIYKTVESRKSAFSMIKRTWKVLFKDIGCWSEIKIQQDKSKQRQRKDKLLPEEYRSLLKYFKEDAETKLIISLTVESLSRPAELLSCKIKGIEDYQDYALINIERGKEGLKKLICIDSYALLKQYLQQYQLSSSPENYLFANGSRNRDKPLTPAILSKRLRKACLDLQLNKSISLYSLKRFGVTLMSLQGASANEISKVAGWTSPKQLSTYDLSTQKEVVDILLLKKGIRKGKEENGYSTKPKECLYCGRKEIGFELNDCPQCLRSLDPSKIRKQMELLQKIEQIPKIEELIDKIERLSKIVEKVQETKN